MDSSQQTIKKVKHKMPRPIITCKLYKNVVDINSKYIITVQIYFCVMYFSFLTKLSINPRKYNTMLHDKLSCLIF